MSASLSVVIITHNEEANIGRTLDSVLPLLKEARGEIIVVDSGSADRTVEIARSYGAKVFSEPWKGYAAQKNSAIEKASGDWILSLDADEEVSPELASEIADTLQYPPCIHKFFIRDEQGTVQPLPINGCSVPRRNLFLGRWIRHGGFWPDRKVRLFRRGTGRVESRSVHENIQVTEHKSTGVAVGSRRLRGALIHHAYPTLAGYIGHMNKYSSLGAEQAAKEGKRGFSFSNIILRPMATFIYNYIFRLGFLDGREGLLLHLYHAAYTSWKYAKLWELTRQAGRPSN